MRGQDPDASPCKRFMVTWLRGSSTQSGTRAAVCGEGDTIVGDAPVAVSLLAHTAQDEPLPEKNREHGPRVVHEKKRRELVVLVSSNATGFACDDGA